VEVELSEQIAAMPMKEVGQLFHVSKFSLNEKRVGEGLEDETA
jgi:hypothetical protein